MSDGGAATSQAAQQAAHASGGEAPAPKSMLLVDVGSVFTSVALVGMVDNRYRLLSRATVETTTLPPYSDILVGVRDAIVKIERTTGHALLVRGGLLSPEDADGSGVDALAISTTVGGPLRVLTMGPGREALAGLLARAMGGLFIEAESMPNLPPADDEEQWQDVLAQLRAFHPHAIIMVGVPFDGFRGVGTLADHSAALARWLDALRAEAPDGEAPFSLPIVFTGTTPDGVTLAANISARSPMVHTVEPLTPTTLAPMTRILATLYDGLVLRDVPGYVRLRSAARAQANATITALGGVVRYLAHQYRMNVIGVDVGASSTTLAGATASGEFLPALFSQGGVGPGAGYVLRATDANNLIRWIAATADENMLREYAIHRMTRPRTLAATELELEIEHAFAREAIRMAMRGRGARLGGLNPIDLALSTGGVLSNVSHPALAALILLDGLEPKGITSLALDVANLAGMLGSAAYLSPRIAADVTDADALPLLIGPAVSLAGKPADGEPALRVTLQRGDGSEHTQEVAAGTIVRLPVRNGEQVLLSLFPAATVDAGLGMGQQARANEPIEGGELGIIVDARGRPFAFPASPEERIAKLLSWRRSLMGTGGH